MRKFILFTLACLFMSSAALANDVKYCQENPYSTHHPDIYLEKVAIIYSGNLASLYCFYRKVNDDSYNIAMSPPDLPGVFDRYAVDISYHGNAWGPKNSDGFRSCEVPMSGKVDYRQCGVSLHPIIQK